MAGISTGTGLISGIDYASIIEKLMAINSKPVDNLTAINKNLAAEQTALTNLSSYLLATQYVAENLTKEDLYASRSATSSNSSTLSATVTGTPAKGTYLYTPVQTAQASQFLSTGVSSTTAALGGGTVSFRYGDNVERSTSLSLLNGGDGFTRGKIRITDRSGTSAQIDLSTAQTIDDVLDAINNNTTINVTAEADGDRIKLTDNTGQTTSNLKVQEVSGGKTASSLGLSGINAASDVAEGEDVLQLTSDLSLDALNDGSGISADRVFSDIEYTLRDGTTGVIDFSAIGSDGVTSDKELTLGELMDTINAAAKDKLHVEIASDGDRLVMTDLTTGTGTFSLKSSYGSEALQDLGLDGTAVDGVITGRRLMGGLKGVLLSSLKGGNGLGTLGTLNLTDRSGATASVDLSKAETLQDVVSKINAAGIGITASINEAQTGIQLNDTTGSSQSHLIVANGDATNTATALNLAADVQTTKVNSGDLHFQTVAQNTLLSSLNGGDGVPSGKIQITDSIGAKKTVDLSSCTTVGDVIAAINRSGAKVRAEINDTGDGIRIRSTGSGSSTISVAEVNSGTTAAALHLTGTAKSVDIDGTATQVIDGSTTYTVTLDADDTYTDLVKKINDLDAGVTATTFNDGSSKPYRLSLTSSQTGKNGRMVVDTSGLGISFEQTQEACDALLVKGRVTDLSSAILISSSSNKFTNVLEGVTLEVKDGSTSAVTVSITDSSTNLVSTVSTFVTNYNKFRDMLDTYTAYDADADTKSALTGDSAALRMETETADLLSRRYAGVGSLQSLAEVGISIGEDGQLSFDKTVLEEAFSEDPDAVKEFFTTEDRGFAVKFNDLCEQLAGSENSLLTTRLESLDDKITDNEDRIEFLQERLDAQEQRLYKQFYAMEEAIAEMQSNMSVLDKLFGTSSSNSSSSSSSSS